MRNPLLYINNICIQPIGDPHLGREFNVNLNRRGEYEERQYQEFKRLLNLPADLTAIMGDLFDRKNVDEADILRTYQILINSRRKNNKIIILRGNHDSCKNNREKSSFDLLEEMLKDKGIIVVKDHWITTSGLGFFSWRFDKTLEEQIEQTDSKIPFNTVFCHLERTHYGYESRNLIPFDFLQSIGVTTIVNGHEHKPVKLEHDGLKYIGTGSMLPYSHAEHSDEELGEIYITFKDLESLEAAALDGSLKDKHVRVYLSDPALLPEFESLSLQIHKVEEISEGPEKVEIEEYSLKGFFKSVAKANKMSTGQAAQIWQEIELAGGED